ncbi:MULTISPECIES: sensor histidine kinase [Polaromonas]|uniref:histidine kinase n=1 Tax=Polaromonas aquatica TaxID=332657 RepID=A0ABW1U0I0_9BURK
MAHRLSRWWHKSLEEGKESAEEFFASPADWYRKRVLWIKTMLCLAILMIVTGSASVHLYFLLSERAKEIRRELFQRDLRDLVGRFDADERYVIQNNYQELTSERRTLRPLLLPRQYYIGLPPGSAPMLPRQPPRNCFVHLEAVDGLSRVGDRFCSYFGESKTPGRYLFLAATFLDQELVPLKQGDSKLEADAVKIVINANGHKVVWWLTFQLPPSPARGDRFEITAFRQVDENQRDRDKKIEGWAYVQRRDQDAQIVNLIARLDFREFLDQEAEDDSDWPPPGWRDTSLQVERKDFSATPGKSRLLTYRPSGVSDLSLSALGTQIFNAYGSIDLKNEVDGSVMSVEPPQSLRKKLEPSPLGIKFTGGDMLLPAEKSSQPEPLPDTELTLVVSHPWTIIEKGFWQIAVYLGILFIGGILVTLYFSSSLLKPIWEWSRYSERLTKVRRDSDVVLPYGERKNEIGILARAINSLIQVVREQIVRAQAEREARAAETAKKQVEEMQNRMRNLKVMGHEIRTPLQALMALHRDSNTPSRRYINRMLRALPHLLGGAATYDAIGSRVLTIEEFNIDDFLRQVAENAIHSDIENVVYEAAQQEVICRADIFAFEDALTNVLSNANRHRIAGSPIRMTLLVDKDSATVEIWNRGPTISEDISAEIFDFGYSTAEMAGIEGQGIGLYVAQNALRRMDGVLDFRNHEDGVIFTLTLPLAKSLIT